VLGEMSKNFLDLKQQWQALKPDLPQSFKGVVVACSGGLDSTALFWLLKGLAISERNFSLAVTHVAYGLRGAESEGDFEFVRNLAECAGLSFIPYRVSPEDHGAREGRGIQEWARDIRREHFRRLGDQGWVIALAHHLDDQAETAIFRLARGASPAKLLGMRPWSQPFWRPLLSVPRHALVDYVVQNQISYREDSSNAKLDYARNVIRHQVMPVLSQLFPGAASRIVACVSEAAALADSSPSLPLDKLSLGLDMASQVLPSITLNPATAPCQGALGRCLPVYLLPSQSREEARNMLANWIHSQTSIRRQLSRRWLDLVLDRLGADGAAARIADLPGGGFIGLDNRGQLYLWPSQPSGTDPGSNGIDHNLEFKAKRRSQHARSLKGPMDTVLLEPGSQAFLTRSVASKTMIAYRKVPQIADLYPVCYKVYGGAAATRFAYPGQKKRWTLNDQLAVWGVPCQERTFWRFLDANGMTVGFTDGRYLLRPGLKDDVIRDDQHKSDLFLNDLRS
jgi:tRNA(Ile)-lysidine synthetase-like protein